MKYMLDTNICIYAIKNKPTNVLKRIMSCEPSDICVSSITYSELIYGVEKSKSKEKNKIALMLFLAPFKILPFDEMCSEIYGEVRANLEIKGTPIGSMDMLIASHAKREKLTIVTNNRREFDRVSGLSVEDWTI